MEVKEKVKNYLRNSGYSENRINKMVSNPEICNVIYSQLITFERLVAEKDSDKNKTR